MRTECNALLLQNLLKILTLTENLFLPWWLNFYDISWFEELFGSGTALKQRKLDDCASKNRQKVLGTSVHFGFCQY